MYQPMNFQHYNSFSQPQSSHAQSFVRPVSTPEYHSPVRNHVGQNRMVQRNQRQPNQQSAERSSSNNHDTINFRFKNSESKYSGNDEEHLQDYIDSHLTTAEDYKLSPAEKLQFLHNIFRGDTLRFYNAHVKHRATSFGEAVSIIYGHFNSPNVQQRIKADLSTVRLSGFSKKMGSNTKD